MKNLIISSVVAACAILAGCDDLPSEEKMGNISRAVGYAAGKTCDLVKMSDKAYEVTIEVMSIVQRSIPSSNETFEAAWTPIVKETVEKFIADGKIDAGEGEIIKVAMKTVTTGLDYLFDVRYPNAKEYRNLVSVAVDGFSEGFKAVKPVNVMSAAKFDYDEAEYKMAMEYFEKK